MNNLTIVEELENDRSISSIKIVMDYLEDKLPENVGFDLLNIDDDNKAYKDITLASHDNGKATPMVNFKKGKIEYLTSKNDYPRARREVFEMLAKLQKAMH